MIGKKPAYVKHHSQSSFYHSYQTIKKTHTYSTVPFFIIGIALVLNWKENIDSEKNKQTKKKTLNHQNTLYTPNHIENSHSSIIKLSIALLRKFRIAKY